MRNASALSLTHEEVDRSLNASRKGADGIQLAAVNHCVLPTPMTSCRGSQKHRVN